MPLTLYFFLVQIPISTNWKYVYGYCDCEELNKLEIFNIETLPRLINIRRSNDV